MAWIEVFDEYNAHFLHDGGRELPHVQMSNGDHTGEYFNSIMLMQDPEVLEQACLELVTMLNKELNKITSVRINRVVVPAKGAITFGHEFARQMGCLTAYAEKNPLDNSFAYRRFPIKFGEHHLVGDDVISTGKSIEAVTNASFERNCTISSFAVAIVNRSGGDNIDGKKLLALINKETEVFKPKNCPLCEIGSKAIRPRENNNWELLNGKH